MLLLVLPCVTLLQSAYAGISNQSPKATFGSINAQSENLPPKVDAGKSLYLVLPQTEVTLDAKITDDGEAPVTSRWVQIGGSNEATISDVESLTPIITLPEQAGEYRLRLFARDGLNASYDDISIYLHDPAKLPEEPIVNAGTARTVWSLDTTIKLEGSYFNGIADSIHWQQIQGPGTARFSTADNLSTMVVFDVEGVYVLELSVDSNGKIGTDRLVVEVHPDDKNYGYDSDFLSTIGTRDLGQEYNYVGLDFNRVKAPPDPGIHPRILVNPEDRADVYDRLQDTAAGQKTMAAIKNIISTNLTGGGNGTIPIHEGGSGQYAEVYDRMANGDIEAFAQVDVTTLLNTNSERGTDDMDRITALIAYEGFRCWVEEDTEGGEKAAAALTSLATFVYEDLQSIMPTNNYRVDIQGKIHRQFIGYAYDFIHPFMTEEQRDTVRKTLILGTKDMWCIGMDAVPIVGANTSNWVSSSAMHLLINTLAIEGEPDSDPNMYPRLLAAYERFYTLGVYDSGMTYEGLGKNTLCAESALAFAKRGDHLIALRGVQNQIRHHYNYSMVPWGNAFTWDESLGYVETEGRYVDPAVVKYAYPEDPLIDFAFRNDLGGDKLPRLNDLNIRFPYKSMDFLVRAITAESWDESKDWEEASQDLTNLPLTFFCNDRGRFITRNDWSQDSLQLHFQPRSVRGGHCFEDRNHIIINALGRNWLTRNAYHRSDHEFHSVLTIDSEGPSVQPAAVIQQYDIGHVALAVGDATDTYNWRIGGGGEPATWTLNDYRAIPSEDPMFSLQRKDFAHWQTSQKSNDSWTRVNQLDYVYRTAALVRGAQPYVLVVDDAKKGENVHNFASRLQLPKDVTAEVDGLSVTLVPNSGEERMWIHVFDSAGRARFEIEDNPAGGSRALVLKTEAVSPDFKMIFFPYMEGDPLPKVRAALRDAWAISIKDQKDILTFTKNKQGLSTSSIQRQ